MITTRTNRIDWAKENDRNIFCAVLAWSRYRFVRFGADQTRETTLRLLVECFEELGGVPGVVLTDRMGCLKAGIVANVVVPHPEYVEFAMHFGFKADFCEGADPESKGIVENLCGYAQRDLLVPALLEPEWRDLDEANAAARRWCAEVNGQVHSETYAVRAERLGPAAVRRWLRQHDRPVHEHRRLLQRPDLRVHAGPDLRHVRRHIGVREQRPDM